MPFVYDNTGDSPGQKVPTVLTCVSAFQPSSASWYSLQMWPAISKYRRNIQTCPGGDLRSILHGLPEAQGRWVTNCPQLRATTLLPSFSSFLFPHRLPSTSGDHVTKKLLAFKCWESGSVSGRNCMETKGRK